MATISCHCNQSSNNWDKKQHYSFPLSIDAICEIWYDSASEMSFENVDGRTDDGCLPIL